MKTLSFVVLLVFTLGSSSAQEKAFSRMWELQGTASYQSTERSGPGQQFRGEGWSKSHSVTVTPSCGYFVCDNLELLLDVRYAFDQYESAFSGIDHIKDARHQVGFGIGAAYNYRLTPFFEPYIAAKAGLTWSRLVQDWGYDSGWGQRQVIFPDFVLGGRLHFSSQWAGVIFVEYKRTHPVMDYYNGEWNEYETVLIGFGFSVFI